MVMGGSAARDRAIEILGRRSVRKLERAGLRVRVYVPGDLTDEEIRASEWPAEAGPMVFSQSLPAMLLVLVLCAGLVFGLANVGTRFLAFP